MDPTAGTESRQQHRPSESGSEGEGQAPVSTKAPRVEAKQKRRHATVYDAVAGRVLTTDPLTPRDPSRRPPPRHRRADQHHRQSGRSAAVAPQDALFARRGAPPRYAEKDVYFAHEDLPDAGRGLLPDSDLLHSVHVYASHFYDALDRRQRRQRRRRRGRDVDGEDDDNGDDDEEEEEEEGDGAARLMVDEQSMDETALLAFGILLEEAGREVLGRSGDLVFTEGAEDDASGVGGDARGVFWRRKYPKRRKVDEEGEAGGGGDGGEASAGIELDSE